MGQGNRKKGQVDEALAGATEKVLKQIKDLYDGGLAPGSAGSIGIVPIAQAVEYKELRRPRKKVTVLIVGNHSAGKSSFINWYIGENIQKTGVAIETRGFTFVTSGKKRETLTGDATARYFDFLGDFSKIPGIMSNMFTEISTSREKQFLCVDLIDSPGLVDGDNMMYPFDVDEAILQMAEHVDLVLVFFDPIGQATCKRTLSVVERLNNGPHVEKVHYFMSKADAVDKEHDRQRVLIQITQNLATRIRNSHAFKLPTFYLPRDDVECHIPNAIEEVCQEVDKAINMTVQKTLRQLKDDCTRISAHIDARIASDKARKSANMKRVLQGSGLYALASLTLLLLGALLAARVLPTICKVSDAWCTAAHLQMVVKLQPAVAEHFQLLGGLLVVIFVVLAVLGKLTYRVEKVFTKKEIKAMEGYKGVVTKLAEEEGRLYEEYFKTLSHADR